MAAAQRGRDRRARGGATCAAPRREWCEGCRRVSAVWARGSGPLTFPNPAGNLRFLGPEPAPADSSHEFAVPVRNPGSTRADLDSVRRLYSVYCILDAQYCIFSIVYRLLHAVYCILHSVYYFQRKCKLYTVYSILRIVYCTLYIV